MFDLFAALRGAEFGHEIKDIWRTKIHPMKGFVHNQLPCGVEYGVCPLGDRSIVSFQIRILAGACDEPVDKLGLARLLVETIDKETAQKGGRELLDAFDVIGTSPRIGSGRETMTFGCTVLPEHFDRAMELHAEFLRTPTFPEESFTVNKELALQELVTLEDDAHSLADKHIGRLAYGSILGRHPLGEKETLSSITRDDVESYWRSRFSAGRMIVSVAGAVEPEHVAAVLQRCFDGFAQAEPEGRGAFEVDFAPTMKHFEKALEQVQIGICWPGVDVTHEDFPIQQVMLGLLSGGMSGRLFTEVREKLGLVYWVGAWHETPRGSGMVFLGASTKPERCEQTYEALLREVERLGDDIEPDELERAITGIVANYETRGDSTQAKCGELAADLFFHQRPIAVEDKIAKIKVVDAVAIRRYLNDYPRDRLCVVTLGPRGLSASQPVPMSTKSSVEP